MLPTVISPCMRVFPPTNKSCDIAIPPRAVSEPPLPIPRELVVFVTLTTALAVNLPESNDNESILRMGLVPLPASS